MLEFIEEIRSRLLQPLPGEVAHSRMMSYRRASVEDSKKMNPSPRESAVLMLLFPRESKWHTVFILRPSYDGVHSGQVAFPGGKKDEGDASLEHTALRETNEEIGIDVKQVEILGSLSEIYIPPSHFLVQPFVGFMKSEPAFFPDSKEVERIIIEPLDIILLPETVKEKPVFIKQLGVKINAAYFDLDGETVWGATAMMLMEFREAMNIHISK